VGGLYLLRPSQQPPTAPQPRVAKAPVVVLEPVQLATLNHAQILQLDHELTGQPAQLQPQLEAALTLPADQRHSLLAVLLLRWAKQDPAAAIEWVFEHIPHHEIEIYYPGLALEWVKRDVQGFAKWYPHFYKNRPADGFEQLTRSLHWVFRENPLLYGETLADPVFKIGMGGEWREKLPFIKTQEEASALAASVTPHIGYQSSNNNSNRNLAEHTGWNALAETAAIRWWLTDKPACQTWLGSLDEMSQKALQVTIDDYLNEEEQKKKYSQDKNKKPPAVVPAFNRENPDQQPTGTFTETYTQWAQWYKLQPTVAEEFLTNSTWPEELKFRARAKGYTL
jgi:hypothetical protein